MSQRERADVYTIPPNFAKKGTILSGRVEARNAVEASVLVLFLLRLLLSLDWGTKAKIYAGIVVIIPVAIFSVLGVQGESLTSFMFQFFRYLARRRVLTAPDARYRLKRNRKLRKQEEQRKKMSGKKGGGRNGKQSQGTGNKIERSEENGKTETESKKEGGKREPEK